MFNGKPFPIPCPHCGDVGGWPAQALSVDRAIVVEFRCEPCGHVWVESMPTLAAKRPGTALPLVERRKTSRGNRSSGVRQH